MKKQGFTILEILVVLAILAILIGIAVPRIKGMQEQANITKAKAELKTIQTALEAYYINKGFYPPMESSVELTEDILAEKDIPKILSEVLYDPFLSGNEYHYRLSANGKYYVIFSVGIDQNKGTEIDDDGKVSAVNEDGNDDICITNGSGC